MPLCLLSGLSLNPVTACAPRQRNALLAHAAILQISQLKSSAQLLPWLWGIRYSVPGTRPQSLLSGDVLDIYRFEIGNARGLKLVSDGAPVNLRCRFVWKD